ncbi:hypothetical protein LQZ18_13620 [Lachnospiraceae bacterium ZAX-1]
MYQDFKVSGTVLKKYHSSSASAAIPEGITCIWEGTFDSCKWLTIQIAQAR